MPTNECTLPQATAANWQYVLVAQCSSSSITIGSTNWVLTKNLIGLIAVFLDLIGVFIFWCSMLGLKQL